MLIARNLPAPAKGNAVILAQAGVVGEDFPDPDSPVSAHDFLVARRVTGSL